MSQPLVTVVCLCYNQEAFVEEAIESVVKQSYKNLQIIVVDDASTDRSGVKIKHFKEKYPFVELMLLPANVGNCKAFNSALNLIKGEFVIDFATDDIMMPDKVERQVDFFLSLDKSIGVVFTDAVYIDKQGGYLRDHYQYLLRKKLLKEVPQGDIYRDVLAHYFIAAPTMMMRSEVLTALKGYDENLAYEDFDFWVRSSRLYKYAFLNEKLIKIRKTKNSMSSQLYNKEDRQLHSTYLVCRKAQILNRDVDDKLILIKRVRYEMRQAVMTSNHADHKSSPWVHYGG